MTNKDQQLWAAEQLDLPMDASAEQAEAAFLKRLEDCGFVPYEPNYHAWQILAGRTSQPPRYFQEDVEPKLREEIEAFAGMYFELASADRRRRWDELSKRCTNFPALQHRLKHLARGLDFELSELDSLEGAAKVLATEVCQLYPMPGAQQVLRRHVLLKEKADERSWSDQAWRIQNVHPRIATMASDYLQRLVSSPRVQKDLAKARKKTARKPLREVVVRSPESDSWSWLPYLAVPAIIALITLINSTKEQPRGRLAPIPPYRPPVMTPEATEAFRRMLEDPEGARRLMEQQNLFPSKSRPDSPSDPTVEP